MAVLVITMAGGMSNSSGGMGMISVALAVIDMAPGIIGLALGINVANRGSTSSMSRFTDNTR